MKFVFVEVGRNLSGAVWFNFYFRKEIDMFEDKKEVRVKALELVLELKRGQVFNDVDKVVEGAKKFEKFILGEGRSK